MTYLALLRGINVGGNNIVSMAQLVDTFNLIGSEKVKTYINSGNVIFNDKRSIDDLSIIIQEALLHKFGFEIKVLLLDKLAISRISSAIPTGWKNDDTMRCDVMFLWGDKNSQEVINEAPIKSDIDNVIYVKGALIWSVARNNVTSSGLSKLIGTDLYKKMTIRNCNTVRMLAELAAQQ